MENENYDTAVADAILASRMAPEPVEEVNEQPAKGFATLDAELRSAMTAEEKERILVRWGAYKDGNSKKDFPSEFASAQDNQKLVGIHKNPTIQNLDHRGSMVDHEGDGILRSKSQINRRVLY